MHKLAQKVSATAASAAVLALGFGALGNGGATADAASGLPKLSFKGTITMYAQGYTPLLPGQKVTPGTHPLTALDQAAATFEKLYPNIHIKFLPNTAVEGTNQWYATEGVAGQLPDIS